MKRRLEGGVEESTVPLPTIKKERLEPANSVSTDSTEQSKPQGQPRVPTTTKGKNHQKNQNKKKKIARKTSIALGSGSDSRKHNSKSSVRKPITHEKTIKSNAHATSIIRKFHELTKKLAALKQMAHQDNRTTSTALLLQNNSGKKQSRKRELMDKNGSNSKLMGESDRDSESEDGNDQEYSENNDYFDDEEEGDDNNDDDNNDDDDDDDDNDDDDGENTQSKSSISTLSIENQISEIEKEIEALGGIKAYQDASIFNHTFHQYNTAKWIVSVLENLNLRPKQNPNPTKLRLLDVGALTNHYLPHSKWIDTKAIDLVPRHSSVEQMDFFDLPVPSSKELKTSPDAFDVVVLSLVINCVPLPTQRGNMLIKTCHLLRPEGLAFIILPLPCLENSRYLTEERFKEQMTKIGFVFLEGKVSPKLWFSVWKKNPPLLPISILENNTQTTSSSQQLFPKKVLRSGKMRNNFAVIF